MRRTRTRRPVSTSRSNKSMLVIGLVGVGFALLLLWIGFNAPKNIPGRSYYNLYAEFDDADNLTSSYQIRVGGKLVGQVLRPEVRDGKARVQLQLRSEFKPLRSDTTLRVRPRSPVGVRFVEVVPGTKGRELDEGETIPANQTSETVQLDQALDTLDTPRRKKVQTFLNELGAGLASRGEDNSVSLQRAPQFLEQLDDISDAVNDRDGAPRRFIAGAQGAANAADPVRQDIAEGFEPESGALDVFDRNEGPLTDTLRTAPVTLPSVRTNLATTDPTLREVAVMAREMRPLFRSAPAALGSTATLLDEGRRGLDRVPATTDLVERAVPPTLKLLDTVRPVLPDLEATFRRAAPLLDELGPRGCDINLFVRNWKDMLNYGTSAGTFLRLNVQAAGEENLGGGTKKGAFLSKIRSNSYPAPCEAGNELGGTR